MPRGCKCQLLINSSEMPRAKTAISNSQHLFGYLTKRKKGSLSCTSGPCDSWGRGMHSISCTTLIITTTHPCPTPRQVISGNKSHLHGVSARGQKPAVVPTAVSHSEQLKLHLNVYLDNPFRPSNRICPLQACKSLFTSLFSVGFMFLFSVEQTEPCLFIVLATLESKMLSEEFNQGKPTDVGRRP